MESGKTNIGFLPKAKVKFVKKRKEILKKKKTIIHKNTEWSLNRKLQF